MAISHAGHNHPATPAGRAACRKSNGNPSVARIESDGFIPGTRVKVNFPQAMGIDTAEIRMTGAVARRIARQAAASDAKRIQPRRSGARVNAKSSTCVQAALHTGRGRCACGWEDWAA